MECQAEEKLSFPSNVLHLLKSSTAPGVLLLHLETVLPFLCYGSPSHLRHRSWLEDQGPLKAGLASWEEAPERSIRLGSDPEGFQAHLRSHLVGSCQAG